MAVEVGGWGGGRLHKTRRRERKKFVAGGGSLALVPIVMVILN